MSNNYTLKGLKPQDLPIGMISGQLVKYRPDDFKKYWEDMNFYLDYVEGSAGISEGYIRSTLTGLPILNRYGEISYKNDTISFNKNILLETLIITVEKTRNIVKNSVFGLDGTVKEFITSGDYIINITGTIASDNKWLYPEEELRTFVDLCNVEDSVSISNDYLNKIYNINNIVIESFSFAQSERFSNIVSYSLNCLSDSTDNKIIT